MSRIVGRRIMLSHPTSSAYEPELVKTMSDAFERAWGDFAPRPRNERLAKSLMAGAIVETVEAGNRKPDDLVRSATLALIEAIKIDSEFLCAVSLPRQAQREQ
jgi:hypothetical protein